MVSSVMGIRLIAALLVAWNIPCRHVEGSYPRHLENRHMKHQILANCSDKAYFSEFNVSIHPRKIESCQQPVNYRMTVKPLEDIFYLECFASTEMDGLLIRTKGNTNICHDETMKCPILKGDRLIYSGKFYIPCIMNKGDYKVKAYCKNQDGAMLLCFKWSFTWI